MTSQNKEKSKDKARTKPDAEDVVVEAEVLDDTDDLVVEGIDASIADVEVLESEPVEIVKDESIQTREEHSKASGEIIRYDPLQSYLAEIRHIPALTKEEEHQLAIRYKEHADSMAGYKLVVANLRLVVLIAREYQRNIQNILDLVQEGNIGLLEAIKQYDPYKGVRFPSYAAYWIRAYMLRFLINNLRLVKIGTTQAQRKLFFNLQKEKDKLEAEGFTPEARLLAERLKVRESDVIEMEQRLGLPDMSVDAPLIDGEEGSSLHGLLPDRSQDVEATVANKEFTQNLRAAVEDFKQTVGEREQMIIDRRLFTEEPETLQDIADEFQLSRERVRQIESRLKAQLKEFLKDKLQLGDSGEIALGADE